MEAMMEPTPLEDDVLYNEGKMSPIVMDALNADISSSSLEDNAKQRNLLTILDEAQAMIQHIKSSIQQYTEAEVEHKMNIVRKFLTLLLEPFTFTNPSSIDFHVWRSIAII